MFRSFILATSFSCIAFSAHGHEFWVDAEDYQVEPGGMVVAALRVGQAYNGSSLSFIPPQFRRFDFALGDRVEPVPGTIGDRPAVTMEAPGDGLLVLIHETTDSVLAWSDWESFVGFVEHKDAAWTLEEHKARGLSEEGVKEVYSRYAKALIAIGDGAGEDRAFGLETEIVALENPYTDNMSDGIDVEVLYKGAPRANEQVEIYEKAADDTVVVTTTKTDAEGHATIPVTPGHRYMLDSVVLREPSPELAAAKGVVWESLWANLTFEIPAE